MKILDIFEASYYRDDDKFECPDCRGKGWRTTYHADGPDDYYKDYEPCETCDEKGAITRKQAARLPDEYRKDLKRITEASYYHDSKFVCPACEGKGHQVFYTQYGEDDYDHEYEPCEMCDTSGAITKKQAGDIPEKFQKNLKRITEASYAFPSAKKITFSELSRMIKKDDAEGIILMGAGGDLKDWINGVSDQLYDQGIATSGNPSNLWAGAYELTTSGGRTDLALEFKSGNSVNVGKLAMWRLQFGDASWFSDYVENYKDQFNDDAQSDDDDIRYDPQPGDDEPLTPNSPKR